MDENEGIKLAALNAANAVREKLGYPPVDHLYPGEPDNHLACPITNTVYDDDIPRDKFFVSTCGYSSVDASVEVFDKPAPTNYQEADKMKPIVTVDLDPDAQSFISIFDTHGIPELET